MKVGLKKWGISMYRVKTKVMMVSRIGAAARVVGAMRKEVLGRRELQKKTKLCVFNALIVPTLLYGCETYMDNAVVT